MFQDMGREMMISDFFFAWYFTYIPMRKTFKHNRDIS